MVFGKKPNTEGTLKKKRSMRILFQKQFLLILAQGVNISSLSKPYATIVTDSSAKLESCWSMNLGGCVTPIWFMTSNWSYFEFSHQIHIDGNCLSQ